MNVPQRKCKICKISLPEEDMDKHMEFVHNQKDLESEKENQNENLVNSSENYKPIIEKPLKIYSCPHCDYTSKYNSSDVGKHIRKRHGSSATLKVEIKSVETDKQLKLVDNNALKTEKTREHTCEVCRKPFSSKQAMQTHLINIHKYDSIQARKGTNTYVKQNYKENLEESDFLNSQNVVVEKPGKNERIGQFSCKLCSTEFATKAIFDEHILSVHLETPQLKCHLCHKSFQLERKLKSHIKIVHEFLNEDGQEESELTSMNNSDSAKGQLISKCLFGTFNSPKKRTKNLDFT